MLTDAIGITVYLSQIYGATKADLKGTTTLIAIQRRWAAGSTLTGSVAHLSTAILLALKIPLCIYRTCIMMIIYKRAHDTKHINHIYVLHKQINFSFVYLLNLTFQKRL